MVGATEDWARAFDELSRLYPEARCELNFANPFQLLLATILSAQSTDVRVNMVTPHLFAKYHSPFDFLEVTQPDLENDIKTLGLFRHKAKNILALCRVLCNSHSGDVPHTLEELTALPGVGRKTAHVVLSNAFGLPAMAVDTHVLRVARRIGWATGTTPLAVEMELCQLLPRELWSQAHHLLIWHGRRLCRARSPHCEICPLKPMCPAAV